jgi:hypothetical protein
MHLFQFLIGAGARSFPWSGSGICGFPPSPGTTNAGTGYSLTAVRHPVGHDRQKGHGLASAMAQYRRLASAYQTVFSSRNFSLFGFIVVSAPVGASRILFGLLSFSRADARASLGHIGSSEKNFARIKIILMTSPYHPRRNVITTTDAATSTKA